MTGTDDDDRRGADQAARLLHDLSSSLFVVRAVAALLRRGAEPNEELLGLLSEGAERSEALRAALRVVVDDMAARSRAGEADDVGESEGGP